MHKAKFLIWLSEFDMLNTAASGSCHTSDESVPAAQSRQCRFHLLQYYYKPFATFRSAVFPIRSPSMYHPSRSFSLVGSERKSQCHPQDALEEDEEKVLKRHCRGAVWRMYGVTWWSQPGGPNVIEDAQSGPGFQQVWLTWGWKPLTAIYSVDREVYLRKKYTGLCLPNGFSTCLC